jgi:hypothetical protein
MNAVLDFVHAILETSDAFTQSFHQFGYFFAPEQQKYDQYDGYDFTRAEIQQ